MIRNGGGTMRRAGIMLDNATYTQEKESLAEMIDEIIKYEKHNKIPAEDRASIFSAISYVPEEGEKEYLVTGLTSEEYETLMSHLEPYWRKYRHASANEAALVIERYKDARIEFFENKKTFVSPLLVNGKYKITSLMFPRFLNLLIALGIM